MIKSIAFTGYPVKEMECAPVCRMAAVLGTEGNAMTLHQVTKE